MRISNNIYLLSGGNFSAVGDISMLGEVYGIHTPKGMIIIDSGAPKTGPARIRQTLADLNICKPITHVILTHGHWDHAGGAKELQAVGAKVIIGKEDAIYCTNGGIKEMHTPFGSTNKIKGKYSMFDAEQNFPAFTPDVIIDKDCIKNINGLYFDFIKVPGHSPGSMAICVYVDGQTALFTGDFIQPDGVLLEDFIPWWNGDPNFNREDIVNSALKLMNYETDLILPGHGKICLKNGTAILRHAAQMAFLTMR